MPPAPQISPELKEFCALCRAGKLFAVQDWIASGKPYRMPEGNFGMFPLRVAAQAGFHSLLEVLLKAGVSQSEKNKVFDWAVMHKGLDFVELLAAHGAEISYLRSGWVLSNSRAEVICWLVENGMDVVTGWPIASAFYQDNRALLSAFKRLRKSVPTAVQQATMALRFHVQKENLKWISLLLWAGADPRLEVPRIEDPNYLSTAMEDAAWGGDVEILRALKFNPARDNPTELLRGAAFACRKPLVSMLIEAGGDPATPRENEGIMDLMIGGFERALDGWRCHEALECLALAANAGGRWRPGSPRQLNGLGKSFLGGEPYAAIRHLTALGQCGALEPEVFAALLRSPSITRLLKTPAPGVIRLRKIAGLHPGAAAGALSIE